MRKPLGRLGAVVAAALLAAGCGASGGTAAAGGGGGHGGGGDSGGKVTITSPRSGATVHEPFTLRFHAGDIGPVSSGKDHVHIFVDGKENDYTVVTKDSFVIKGLTPGKHVINVTKQHADHSPTGAKDEITVKVTGKASAGGSKSGGSDNGSSGGGYNY